MFRYRLDLNRIEGFIEKNPTFVQQRRKLANSNERFASIETTETFIGGAIQSAGERFLKRIHEDIWNNKSALEKEILMKEMIDEDKQNESRKQNENIRPELTADYLRSMGVDPTY